MSSGRIARHRNYGEIMARHQRDVKIKRVLRVFIYVLIIAILVLLFYVVKRIEKKSSEKATTAISYTLKNH